jgi:hypothetical protein
MDLEPLLYRICGEFLEMPGLRLTVRQAMRLWGLDREQCERAIDVLIGRSFLRQTAGGLIVRTSAEV